MKKQTLLIIIVIVLLVAIPVCWFGLALGNPLSEYLAKKKESPAETEEVAEE